MSRTSRLDFEASHYEKVSKMEERERQNKSGFLWRVICVVTSVALALGLVPAVALAEMREEILEVMSVKDGRPALELPATNKILHPQAEIALMDAEESDHEAPGDDSPATGTEAYGRGLDFVEVEETRASTDLADFLREVKVEDAVMEGGVAHVVEGREYDVRMTFAERPGLRLADGGLALWLPACLAVSDEQPQLSEPISVRRRGDGARREVLEADGVGVTIEDGELRLAWDGAGGSLPDTLRSLDDAVFDVVVRGSFSSGTEVIAVGGVDLPVSVEAAGQARPEESDLGADGDDGEFQDGQLPPDDPEPVVDDATEVEGAPSDLDVLGQSVALDEGAHDAGGAAEEPQPETHPAVDEASRREYVYADDQVRVVAALADPVAVPDDAELRVRRVSSGVAEAYLDAMNDATGGRPHTERNTLLYDVAFVLDGKEIEPADGSVSVLFAFRKGQLGDDLGAAGPGDVEVTHIVEEGGKLVPEPVEASVSPSRGLATFEAESFSVYAFSYTVDFELGGLEYALPGEGSVRLSSLFAALGVREDVGRVEGVEFSSPELVSVSRSLVGTTG